MKSNTKFGNFGGIFVPETLIPALEELETVFLETKKDKKFHEQLNTFGEGTVKNYKILQQFFSHEATAIVTNLKKIEEYIQGKAIKIAVANNKISHRCSLLKDRLLEAKREF